MPRFAITKRVSLAGIYEGWTDEAYAIITPATYADKIGINELVDSNPDGATALKFELVVAQDHFVSGKGFVLGMDDTLELGDIAKEDLSDMVDLSQRLFIAIARGLDADPKDTPTPMAT